jgi:adenosylmethionine-8-amino-7-oxononanoate aminotransferase
MLPIGDVAVGGVEGVVGEVEGVAEAVDIIDILIIYDDILCGFSFLKTKIV